MNKSGNLAELYRETPYKLAGHGQRNIGVLQEALQQIDAETNSDMYGSGRLIEEFQQEMADVLGKESAVFFPSGTMAQQIALRLACDRKGVKKVAYHPLCHLEIHEQDGLKELHQIETVLLADKDSLITLQDVQTMPDDVACLLLELPQREIGGQLPDYAELAAIAAYCREQGIWLHLDGARLFEVLPYYGKTAAEICGLFDSVYISFYKGLGGIAGAVLAGAAEFTQPSKVWKRRHGGDLISLYPYILSASYYYHLRVGRMQQYYEEAVELAAMLNQVEGVSTLPVVPVSNMFHLHFGLSRSQLEPILADIYEATGVGITPAARETGVSSAYCEINIGDSYGAIPKDKVEEAVELLHKLLVELR